MTAGLWIHRCQLPYTSGSRIKMMHRRSDVFHGTRGSALWWFTCNFWQLFWSVLHKNRINTLTELIKKPVKFFWGGVCFSLWWECILRITFSYSKPFSPSSVSAMRPTTWRLFPTVEMLCSAFIIYCLPVLRPAVAALHFGPQRDRLTPTG